MGSGEAETTPPIRLADATAIPRSRTLYLISPPLDEYNAAPGQKNPLRVYCKPPVNTPRGPSDAFPSGSSRPSPAVSIAPLVISTEGRDLTPTFTQTALSPIGAALPPAGRVIYLAFSGKPAWRRKDARRAPKHCRVGTLCPTLHRMLNGMTASSPPGKGRSCWPSLGSSSWLPTGDQGCPWHRPW